MSNNVVTSASVNAAKEATAPVEETVEAEMKTPKKTTKAKAAKKAADGTKIVVFESGASYNSNGIRFTREERIKEVPEEFADFLLTLENFRLPTSFEVEEYLASKED